MAETSPSLGFTEARKSCPVPWSCLCDLGPVDQLLASSAESGQLSSTRSPLKSTPG